MKNCEDMLIFEALSQIETPEYDIAAAVERQRGGEARPRPVRPVRRGLVAVAVCAVLAVAAGAAAVAGANGMWREFFGPVPTNAVSTVAASQTAGDYTLTVEDAMVDENGALLLLSLRRADGEPIDPDAHMRTNSMDVKLLVDGASVGGSSGFNGEQCSEDGKILYYTFEVSNNGLAGDETLLGKTLTFTADGVAVQLREPDGYFRVRGGEAIPLSPLAETEVLDFTGVELYRTSEDNISSILQAVLDQGVSIPLPLSEFPQYVLRGAAVTDEGLCFILTGGRTESGDRVCTGAWADALVDTRDGARYDLVNSSSRSLPDGARAGLYYFQNCPLTAADLPYLELEVAYSIDRILSEEPFSISFPADSASALTLPLADPLTLEGAELHPTELRLSALGIVVRFADDMDTAGILYTDGTAPVLHLSDGSEIITAWHGGAGKDDGTCSVRFQAEDESGERIFFDTSIIESITFGNLEIPAQ